MEVSASISQPTPWTPSFSRWRHGGWYVSNVHHLGGACGCVSNNYPDRKWRIVCDPRRDSLGSPGDFTFASRDAAARAEHTLAVAEVRAALGDWEQSPGQHHYRRFVGGCEVRLTPAVAQGFVVTVWRDGVLDGTPRTTGCFEQALGWACSAVRELMPSTVS